MEGMELNHIAMYRAWRPQAFRDVVGQRHIVQTLQNSLKEKRFTHAYLFSGPRGTGKTSAAKILAKALNCQHGPSPEPCNACQACIGITEGTVLDVVEIDAASNRGVEEIRDVRDKVKYAPTEVSYKVYIIDEVHMLTTEAFNALLKTLEEPPPHVVFILATTEPGRIPATIISRCQRFDFRRVQLEDQLSRLEHICKEEAIEAEPEALQLLARMSDGGMRDALSMLDQVVSFGGQRITYEDVLSAMGGLANEQFTALAQALRSNDVGKALELVEQFLQEGKSAEQCLESLIYYFRDLLVVTMLPNAQSMTDRILDPTQFAGLNEQYTVQELFQIIDILNHYQVEMKYAQQPQLLFEIAMMKICTSINTVTSHQQTASTRTDSANNAPSRGMDSNQMLIAKQRELEQKVVHLEQRIEQLLASGNSIVNQGNARNSTSRSTQTPHVAESTDHRQGSHEPPLVAGSGVQAQRLKLADFVAEQQSTRTREILAQWSQVLQQVREAKVTVYAWLVDAEPVAVLDQTVLVAFKNTIHRETTEKPANKALIEQVMKSFFQSDMNLLTAMMKDWQECLSSSSGKSEAKQAEPLVLTHAESEPEAGQLASAPKEAVQAEQDEEHVSQALEIFGENLVKIKQ